MTDRLEVLAKLRTRLEKTIADTVPPGHYGLFCAPTFHKNVGDHAIWQATRRIAYDQGIQIEFASGCYDDLSKVVSRMDPDMGILFAGGGNFGDLWPKEQEYRERVLLALPGRPAIQLPQSLNFRDPTALRRAAPIYDDPRVTLLLRDKRSVYLAERMFPAARTVLTPDLAYGLDPRERTDPQVEVFWLTRNDPEAAWKHSPTYGVERADWSSPVSDSQGILDYGFKMVGRGVVLICEKLHGHILAQLSDVPHILLGDRYGKVRSLRDAWTRNVPDVYEAYSPIEAVYMAEELLYG